MRSQIAVQRRLDPKACTGKEIRLLGLSSGKRPLRTRSYGCGGAATPVMGLGVACRGLSASWGAAR